MPATSTLGTEKQLDGHAAVQINCRLGAEDDVAFPAPHPFAFNVGHVGVSEWHRCPPCKALESLVQKNQRVLGLRLAHRMLRFGMLRFAVFSRDFSLAS